MSARVVILGGGFAGVYTALGFEKLLPRHPGIEVTLVNRDNFFTLFRLACRPTRRARTRLSGMQRKNPDS